MIRYFFKIGWRNLWKNKKLFLINIGGLAFGMSICLAITLFFLKEYSFDRYHVNADVIYRLVDKENNSSGIDYRVKDLVTDNFPEIENACLVQIVPSQIDVNNATDAYYLNNILSTDNAIFEMFSIPFLKGNPQKPFPNTHAAILTESAAQMLFKGADPMGKEIVIRHMNPVIVSGVIRDFPDNSSIQADILVNAENDNFKFHRYCSDCTDSTTLRFPFRVYLQLNPQSKPDQLIAKVNKNAGIFEPYLKETDLLPLKETYLYDATTGSRAKKGNPKLLQILAVIGLIILSLAFINYNNLVMARQSKRNKETGVRKIFGAFRRDIYGHFFAEAILLTFLSFIVAMTILVLSLPFYESVFDRSLDIGILWQFPTNVFLLLVILTLGILAGVSPALVYASFNPVKIFRGDIFRKRGGHGFRNGLTTFQFAVSIGLIACLIIIQRQIQFVKEKKTGFSEEQLLRIQIPNLQQGDQGKLSTLIRNLSQYPEILDMSLSNGAPGQINMFWGAGIEGKNKSVPIISVDSVFIKTFGIELSKGRLPRPSEMGATCLVNEAALKYFEWDEFEGKTFNNGGGFEVVGVVKDFHFNSLHKAIDPLCIVFMMDHMPGTDLSIRLAGNNISGSLDNILAEWKKVLPDYALKYEFYDEWFDAMYRQEEKFASTIGLFALLAISISCVGILGLAMFNAESRTKEIGIRKVLGASISNILILLTKDFGKLIAIAFVIAIPVANYFISEWLAAFAYRIDVQWWLFGIPGVVVLAIAFLIVGGQSLKAATINPADSLRNE